MKIRSCNMIAEETTLQQRPNEVEVSNQLGHCMYSLQQWGKPISHIIKAMKDLKLQNVKQFKQEN